MSHTSGQNSEQESGHKAEQLTGLLPLERRAAVSLSMIYGVRMLGLFIILPVFSLFASDYKDSTPVLIGLGLGIYGLCQAVLQIPFGVLSDRVGRKPVIIAGLLLFLLGSLVAASAESIYTVIAGRALQGAGAISAALIALAADLTRDEQRTKIMGILGGSIGLAFVISLVMGPVLVRWFSLSGLFWFTGVCAAIALFLVWYMVPTPATQKVSGDTVANLAGVRQLLRDDQLLRLDISIFVLHLIVTATFVGVPLALVSTGHVVEAHWQFYLPALLMSVFVMIPAIIIAEKYRRLRIVFLLAVAGIGLSQMVLLTGVNTGWVLFAGIALFFSFFNTLEALLPSLVSKLAPPGAKGSAMGVYSSSQFFGAFAGGVGGGWLYGQMGLSGLFGVLSALCILWFIAAWGLRNPRSVSSYILPVGKVNSEQGSEVARACAELPGVEDAVVVIDEGVAYLKIDRKLFDPASLVPIRAAFSTPGGQGRC